MFLNAAILFNLTSVALPSPPFGTARGARAFAQISRPASRPSTRPRRTVPTTPTSNESLDPSGHEPAVDPESSPGSENEGSASGELPMAVQSPASADGEAEAFRSEFLPALAGETSGTTPEAFDPAAGQPMAPRSDPDLFDLGDYLSKAGWSSRTPYPPRKSGLAWVHHLELERQTSIHPSIQIFPVIQVIVADFPAPEDIPGGDATPMEVYGESWQRLYIAPLIGDWRPAYLRVLREDRRVHMVGTHGHVFREVVDNIFDQLKSLTLVTGERRTALAQDLLEEGARAARALEAQALLNILGFYQNPVDGHWGPKSRDAMVAFQAVAGLPTTGDADERSLPSLRERSRSLTGR